MEECVFCGQSFQVDMKKDIFQGKTGEPVCNKCKHLEDGVKNI